MTLNDIIAEGKEIRQLIKYVPPSGYRSFKVYQITDRPKYEKWKNLVIRFLSASYPEDRCVTDFESKVELFKKSYFAPSVLDDMLGLLESCSVIPQLPIIKKSNSVDKSINVSVNQNQSQTQEQSLAIDIFLEAIKDEITGKQLKELKAIAQEEPNPEKVKNKILDKIKSWGEGISASIVANIITNPNVWSGLM